MRFPSELKWACAACAPALGAAFISGREAATFFAVTGPASWAGIAAASVIFGLVMGMLAHFGSSTGMNTLPGVFSACMDERCGEAIGVVYGILMIMMGAVALTTAGELGMLSLDISHPALITAAIAMTISVMLTLHSSSPLTFLGRIFIPVCIAFFTALAADKRPAAAGVYIRNSLSDVSGNAAVALFMGAMFAFLKAAVSGSLALGNSQHLSPGRFGFFCGGIMALTTGSANLALQSAGSSVWPLNLPFVVLAARCGTFGYYTSIYIMFLGSIAVIACALSSVCALLKAHFSRFKAMSLAVLGITAAACTGLKPLVNVGYPMLGWLCAMCLMALSVFYKGEKTAKNTSFPIK